MQPYVVPFVLYLLATSLAANWPAAYPVSYAAIVVACSIVTARLLRGRGIVAPHRHVMDAVVVGLVGIGLWIGLSNLHLESHLTTVLPEWLRPGARVAFNPFEELDHAWQAWLFVAFRIVGLSVIVPIAEELFWRGFLARWLIAADWEKFPLGRFTPFSFAAVTALFTLAHPEWFAAAVYCTLINGLLIWKRDLWRCIVAHGISNLVLAVYVLATESWWLW